MTALNVTLIFRSSSRQTRVAFTSRQQSGICLKERKHGNVPLTHCTQSVPRRRSQRDGLILPLCAVSQSFFFFTHMWWPEADFTPRDSTVKSIYLHTHECLFYLALSAVMVQAVCMRTQSYQHVSICQNLTPLWALTERSFEFWMLYIGKHIYFSNAAIITAVNRNALIVYCESETQKLEWRARAWALYDYSELEFQRRSNVYSS